MLKGVKAAGSYDWPTWRRSKMRSWNIRRPLKCLINHQSHFTAKSNLKPDTLRHALYTAYTENCVIDITIAPGNGRCVCTSFLVLRVKTKKRYQSYSPIISILPHNMPILKFQIFYPHHLQHCAVPKWSNFNCQIKLPTIYMFHIIVEITRAKQTLSVSDKGTNIRI